MGRTSIKNKLILSFLLLLLILVAVVGLVNHLTDDFLLSQSISAVLAMMAGIFFGSLFSRSLLDRLNRLRQAARRISQGDLTQAVEVRSHDEVRDLEIGFAGMLEELRAMIADMQHIAAEVQATQGILRQMVDQSAASSRDIDNSAGAIATVSEKQSLIVQEASIRVNEALKDLDRIAGRAAAAVAKIHEARLRSQMGETNTRKTIEDLEHVLKQMGEHAEPILRLGQKIEKIRMVVRIIDDIAQKTELLALNASIEAAKAGEAGKGFTLVASEIRGMAENSKQSSQEINDIILGLLEDNQSMITAIQGSQEKILHGRQALKDIVQTFADTHMAVEAIFSEVKDMESITQVQLNQIKSFLSPFEDLLQLAHQNSLATQKTTLATARQRQDMDKLVEAMATIEDLSQKMLASQRRFRLPG